MSSITLGGNPANTIGQLPQTGTQTPDFKLVNTDLAEVSLSDFAGSCVILNVFPSVDTGICATSTRKFNEKAASLNNTKVVCVSKDLPFAFKRFCGAEGIDNVVCLSDFATGDFGRDYGLTMADTALKGLHSRAVIVLDENGKVIYTEQVPDIAQEPNYEAALAVL